MQLHEIVVLSKQRMFEVLADLGEQKPSNTGAPKLVAAIATAYGISPDEALEAYKAHIADADNKKILESGSENDKKADGPAGFIINVQKSETKKGDVFLGHRGKSVQIQRGKNVLIKPWMLTVLKESVVKVHERNPETGAVLDAYDLVPRENYSILSTLNQEQIDNIPPYKVEFTASDIDAINAAGLR